MSRTKTPLLWTLWHPHQRLWNGKLARGIRKTIPLKPIHSRIIRGIIFLDTLILWLRAVRVRISVPGLLKIREKANIPDDMEILYLDIGTHKEGAELFWMTDEILPAVCRNFKAYGFEAGREAFEYITGKCAGRENISLVQKALVHTLPENGKIKLFKDTAGGIGDSIYRKTGRYETVEAARLSDFLTENNLIKPNSITLLRMNIEGAEYDVIKDLVAHQLAGRIDGYFGMWDDVSKIDPARDAEFRRFLARHHIRAFTCNGRDMRHRLRKKCIAYHIHTCIMQKIEKHKKRVVSPAPLTHAKHITS